jgi:fructokinase
MRKIYCLGETVYDIIFKNGQPVAAKAGGSMLNATVSMGRMRLPVHYISEYGKDNIGSEINNFLISCHVNTDYVNKHTDGKTSIAIAFLNEKNDASYTFYKDMPKKRLDVNLPKPQENDIVLFGSFFAINHEIRTQVREFVTSAKQAGAIILYDPNFRKAHLHEVDQLRPYILENMEMASVVRGSNEDFEMIFGAKTLDEAYNYVSKYNKNLIYTENANGVHLKTPNCNAFCNVHKITPVSTIGAGDNFNAGFIFGLMQNNILPGNLHNHTAEQWQKLLTCGIDFATDVCMSYENYVSEEFASNYIKK